MCRVSAQRNPSDTGPRFAGGWSRRRSAQQAAASQMPRRKAGAQQERRFLPEAGIGCHPNQSGEGGRSQEPSSQVLPEHQPYEQALLKIASSGLL